MAKDMPDNSTDDLTPRDVRPGRSGISRRGLFRLAGAAAATTAAAAALAGCEEKPEEPPIDDTPVVVEAEEGFDILEKFSEVEAKLEMQSEYTLPLGSILHPAEGNWIPVTIAGESASPMITASVLSVTSGDVVSVLTHPITTSSPNVEIFQIRCSDTLFAWVEMDILTRDWWLYAQAMSAGKLSGTATLLWSGDKDWDPAPLCVTGNFVVWQVQPSLKGEKRSEFSHCYLWKLGDAEAKEVIESQGRFACEPAASAGTVTVVPRVRPSEGTYYGITAYDPNDGFAAPIDQLVMPASVKPFRAVRIGDVFAFSVEASYNSGGLLGGMGYYIGTTGGEILSLGREPAAGIAGSKKGPLFIKCRSFYYVVNVEAKTYGYLAAYDRCLEHGEFPARVGECDVFVTFATVKDPDSGYPSFVAVRTFKL